MVTSKEFYKAWVETVLTRENFLTRIWNNSTAFTQSVIKEENSVIKEVATKLKLECYNRDYYSIDSIIYHPDDKVRMDDQESYWFRDIRVAFEHENHFNSGLYQEVSKLLITQCDLKVIVTYPDREITEEFNYLHEIISGTRSAKNISKDENFLIILGYKEGFRWDAYVFNQDGWKKLNLD